MVIKIKSHFTDRKEERRRRNSSFILQTYAEGFRKMENIICEKEKSKVKNKKKLLRKINLHYEIF